jgi:hypothetical protein
MWHRSGPRSAEVQQNENWQGRNQRGRQVYQSAAPGFKCPTMGLIKKSNYTDVCSFISGATFLLYT